MASGILLKHYGGFYFVLVAGQVYTCRIRGSLRRGGDIYPGDRVDIRILAGTDGVIEAILPRQNELLRPKMANVDQCLIVLAVCDPEPDMLLLDKILLQASYHQIDPLICFNKTDLMPKAAADHVQTYRRAGYFAFANSNCEDMEAQRQTLRGLQEKLLGKITVLAGPSGAGKSSLINRLYPEVRLQTGAISDKSGRGKHTTRFAQLLPLDENGTLLADTPGFSLLDLPKMVPTEVAAAYWEMARYASACRFQPCLHDREPDCKVKEAKAGGLIDAGRYERYLLLLEQVRQQKERYDHD